jgi:hypothetical protein
MKEEAVSAPPKRINSDDLFLAKKLDELQSQLQADSEFPDVIAVWEAIKRITGRNQRCVERGIAPYPLPEWVNEYLLRSSDKIGRLELGIRVEDDRPLPSINFNEVGELRKFLRATAAGIETSELITSRRPWDLSRRGGAPFSITTRPPVMLIIWGSMTIPRWRTRTSNIEAAFGGQLSSR